MNGQRVFDEYAMTDEIRTIAHEYNLQDTESALKFAWAAHDGQFRKRSNIPYINHPLLVCRHAIALGILEDSVLAACLLHDVVEDCGVKAEELPVSEEAKNLVLLLTHGPKSNKEAMENYYARIAKNPKAALIKCIDRCNNLSTLTWGFDAEGQERYKEETIEHIIPLLETVYSMKEYRNAAWLLEYQMKSYL